MATEAKLSRTERRQARKEAQKERNDAPITEFLAEMERNDRWILKDAHSRHIIFVGKSRSGKSTAVRVMRSPVHLAATASSIFYETEQPELHTFTVERAGTNYNLSVIDTPGLFEQTKVGCERRDEEVLEKLIDECMRNEITKLHGIYFVMKYEGALNLEDVKSLERFMSHFEQYKGASDHFHILIMGGEKLPKVAKDQFVDELTQERKLSPILNRIIGNDPGQRDKKIHFLGALSKGTKEGGYLDELKNHFANVNEMRSHLFETIVGSSETFSLMPSEKTSQAKGEGLLRELRGGDRRVRLVDLSNLWDLAPYLRPKEEEEAVRLICSKAEALLEEYRSRQDTSELSQDLRRLYKLHDEATKTLANKIGDGSLS